MNSNGSVETPREPRLWPALAIVGLLLVCQAVVFTTLPGTMPAFIVAMLGPLAAFVLLLAWWVFFSRVGWKERGLGFLIVVGGLTAVVVALQKEMRMALPSTIIPVIVYSFGLAATLTGKMPWFRRRWVLVAVIGLAAAPWLFTGMDGLNGDFMPELRWRWEPSREQTFLRDHVQPEMKGVSAAGAVEIKPGDWPGFRGAARDSRVSGLSFGSDWKTNPPREVWRRKVGLAYSSFAVVGGLAFTQEQHKDEEAVVCYDAATGGLVWQFRVKARFDEAISGLGPRATPQFEGGKLFVSGATGLLLCLDALSGRKIWQRDVVADTGASIPEWGYSASPVVVDGLVIAFAATNGSALVAYDAETGEKRWSSGPGSLSYGSPHVMTLCGEKQVLLASDVGVFSCSPKTGGVLWTYAWPARNGWRALQPLLVAPNELVMGTPFGEACRFAVKREGDAWHTEKRWCTSKFTTYISDAVYHNGYLFGFNNGTLECVSTETGERKWRGLKAGHGQALLIVDMGMLLVQTEKGRIVLVGASPEQRPEVASLQVLNDKTWNCQALAGRYLYVRNGSEAACYELPPANGAEPRNTKVEKSSGGTGSLQAMAAGGTLQ